MYDDGKNFVGEALAASFNKFATMIKRDRKNLQEKVIRYRIEGVPVSERLDRDIFDAAYMLHDEVPLHSYPRPIMPLMRQLRKLEQSARKRITIFRPDDYILNDDVNDGTPASSAAEKRRSGAAALKSLFAVNASEIVDIHHLFVREGISLLEKENLTDEDRLKLYTAASVLFTLVDLWDEAATLMATLELETAEDSVLDFEFLGIERLCSVVDVAQTAFDLYEEVDASLLSLARSTTDGDRRRVIEHDRQIAGTNMASLASYGFDWMQAESKFLAAVCAGLEAEGVRKRSADLAKRGHFPLEMSVALFNRHNDHVLLGRNVIRMAVQQKNKNVLCDVARQVASLVGCDQLEIFDVRLAGRKAIKDEPHPKIDEVVRSWLTPQEAAR
jgi:hypothetical protein